MNVTYQNGWAVPAGWKLVPVEPTPEMIVASRLDIPCRCGEYEAVTYITLQQYDAMLAAAPAAPQPDKQHPDDAAVDAFAAAMKAKLKRAREEKGRGGWQDMSATELSAMLREHVEKGDPVDVANLAMMLHQNGQGITPAEPVKVPSDALREAVRLNAQAVPGGWKLVPVEATDEMVKVGDQKTWVFPSRECWAAMLSAAPAAPQPAQQEREAIPLLSRIAELEAKLAEAQKDSARLDYVATGKVTVSRDNGGFQLAWYDHNSQKLKWQNSWHETARAAIDAALAQQEPPHA